MLTIQSKMSFTQAIASSSGSSPNYPSTSTTSPNNTGSLCGAESHDSNDMSSAHNNSTDLSSAASSSDGHLLSTSLSTKCPDCNETFVNPKVLDCFHTFCQMCLEKQLINQTLACPECQYTTSVPSGSISSLPSDAAVTAVLETKVGDKTLVSCTGCKNKDTNAIARCFDCANFLCPNCVTAHKFMHCFEGHRVKSLEEMDSTTCDEGNNGGKVMYCDKHKTESYKQFCKTCDIPICNMCEPSHKIHEVEALGDSTMSQVDQLRQIVGSAKVKANHIRSFKKGVEHSSNRLQVQYEKAQNEVSDTYDFYKAALEERKQEILRELESTYKTKQVTLSGQVSRMQSIVDRLYMGCEFIDKLIKYSTPLDALVSKRHINSRIQELLAFQPDNNSVSTSSSDLEFVSNYQAIQVGVKNTFGYIRQPSSDANTNGTGGNKPQPIARPNSSIYQTQLSNRSIGKPLTASIDNLSLGKLSGSNTSLNSLNGFSFTSTGADVTQIPAGSTSPYDAWSTGLDTNSSVSSTAHDLFTPLPSVVMPSNDQMIELTTKLMNANIYPPKSQIKRQKMIYHCKFGEFGVMEGQFTEPSGVAVNAQNDIIVADTNNHRIQIFDREGRFKFQFGECGKRDGQLLYPNRVAVVKQTGDIVVTERSPTHQVQIFNQYGQFVRKFGANVLQHPRGVTVDNMGRIVIVECKVMRVIIFDLFGNILQKFSCSKHLEFPNGVVVNDREEIFISDNRAHCVKVFNYQGQFVRQIGGEGVSNYPIGVGINSTGEVLIADNHNNFNLTVFTQDGQILSALESKVKHAQCFDVALLDDNSIVLASKDYRLYIYRYSQASHSPPAPYSYLGISDPLTLDTF